MVRRLREAAVTVGLHVVANAAHGVPHAAAPVPLAPWQSAFVFGVVLSAPLAALGLLWTGGPERTRVGAVLFSISMAASLVFGLYFHFVVPNPDHVSTVSAGPWRGPFRATAVLVALVDAVGVAVGIRIASNAAGRPT
jgi:hypothetical protein